MLDLESVKVDLAAEQEGTYIDVPEWEGVSLGVRSLEIPAYKMAIDAQLEKYKRLYGKKGAPADIREADIGKILAKHILFGWKGIKQDYSPAYALETLSDPTGRELAKKIVDAASKVAEVEAKFTEDAVKN